MIHNPVALIIVLITIESSIFYLANHKHFSKYFEILPSVFWIYFLPMLASSFGLIDSQSPIYSKITDYFLPPALFLLLITVDIKAILRLGPSALVMFFIGTLSIMIGMVTVFLLLKNIIGVQYWAGFGALSGSWTGGSANMIAVKEALGTPDSVFLPMVIVDTIVPYVWMGIMVSCVGFTAVFDRWNRSDRGILDDLQARIQNLSMGKTSQFTWLSGIGLSVLALAGGFLSIFISHFLPEIKGIISTYAWTIIIVSCLGILLSSTPVRKLEKYGTNKVGYFILYFVLTSIGAKASVHHLGTAFILIAAGFVVIFIHALFLFMAVRCMRIPLFLAVVASQANVGGVASAPLVAEIYQKGFASVGLLLAILGNIEGTYIGILVGQICHFFAH